MSCSCECHHDESQEKPRDEVNCWCDCFVGCCRASIDCKSEHLKPNLVSREIQPASVSQPFSQTVVNTYECPCKCHAGKGFFENIERHRTVKVEEPKHSAVGSSTLPKEEPAGSELGLGKEGDVFEISGRTIKQYKYDVNCPHCKGEIKLTVIEDPSFASGGTVRTPEISSDGKKLEEGKAEMVAASESSCTPTLGCCDSCDKSVITSFMHPKCLKAKIAHVFGIDQLELRSCGCGCNSDTLITSKDSACDVCGCEFSKDVPRMDLGRKVGVGADMPIKTGNNTEDQKPGDIFFNDAGLVACEKSGADLDDSVGDGAPLMSARHPRTTAMGASLFLEAMFPFMCAETMSKLIPFVVEEFKKEVEASKQ